MPPAGPLTSAASGQFCWRAALWFCRPIHLLCRVGHDRPPTPRASRADRAESPSVPTLCAVTRAPSHIRNTSSARRSGSASLASLHSLISRSRSSVLYSRMTRRAGWSWSGSSTAALASAQPRSASFALKSQTWRSQARSWPFGSPAWAAAIASQATSNSCVKLAETGGDQHVLRGEVAIERHLVGACRLRDRVDADGMDATAIEQLAGGRENPLTWRQAAPCSTGGRRLAVDAIMFAPSLDMLQTGQYLSGVTGQCHANLARVRADFHPCPKGRPMDHRELTLAELLADPITLAVMAADLVDPAALKAMLAGLAGRLHCSRGPAEPTDAHCAARDDRPW